MITVERVYEVTPHEKGKRFLVDRLWPRGVKKENLKIDAWLKDLAPSNELRKRFHHDPEKWDEFRKQYYAELKQKPEALKPILAAAREGDTVLLYGAKDVEHNNAVALKDYIEHHRSPSRKKTSNGKK